MYLNWDDAFLPKAKEVWEKYHEFRCSWSVIRYFPEEYLLENMSSFNAPKDYYFLCLRLGHRQDFTIDRTRLTNKDYIGVLHHNRLPIEDDEALDLLFETVHDICVNENFNRRYDLIENRYYIPTNIYSIKSFHDIGESLYYLKEMGRFRVVEDFCKWNDEIVCRNMTEGPEIKKLASLIKDEDVIECAGIAKNMAILLWMTSTSNMEIHCPRRCSSTFAQQNTIASSLKTNHLSKILCKRMKFLFNNHGLSHYTTYPRRFGSHWLGHPRNGNG